MDDYRVWQDNPAFRSLYNKLDLSLRLGYIAGPAGCPVPITGEYVIRPIINLSGMGATAYIQEIKADVDHDVPPGYFWCERFTGEQISVNYSWRKADLYAVSATQGWNSQAELYRFSSWKLLDIIPEFAQVDSLPNWIDSTMGQHITSTLSLLAVVLLKYTAGMSKTFLTVLLKLYQFGLILNRTNT